MSNFFNGLQHIGIPTENFKFSEDVYSKLGFKLIQTEDNQGSKVGFFELGNLILEVWEAETAPTAGAINHFALDTNDIEAAFSFVKGLNLELIDPEIQQLPFWEHGIRYFNFYGPNHEIIEICQKK
ncbi:VOC family protein [Xylocopilactobacillus apicola]|uniref:Lactoylglutathione lyase n=1 Tax=Xylocopilactobacillus apicola TaxID=2932184 RepID=A0AAU9DBA6_9LACO|nr:VOC family protein [Xylocopilactobacillus apicola]BDR58067.1 lactoylglutathione lyase [Xylocopilactobacillus apicola]